MHALLQLTLTLHSWVFGRKTSKSGGKHTYYSPGSTAQRLAGETWSISYGDGSSASGNVYTDTVTIGGTTVTGQAVESADTASSSFTTGAPDGLVGLGFDNINTVTPKPQLTFMTNAINQGLPAVFTADLKAGKPGSYGFGQIDDSLHTGAIAYTPVDSSQGFWTFTPDVGDVGIADTGTTLMLLSSATTQAYYSQISSAAQDSSGNWMFSCTENPPDFNITVGGYTAVVPGAYMNLAPNNDTGNTCFGGIQTDSTVGQAIYGDVFLKSQFVVFDQTQGTPRLGLAPKPL